MLVPGGKWPPIEEGIQTRIWVRSWTWTYNVILVTRIRQVPRPTSKIIPGHYWLCFFFSCNFFVLFDSFKIDTVRLIKNFKDLKHF